MKYAADIPSLANASQQRRYRGNCPWFLAMWLGFESVPSSAQHLALSLTIEWYRPEALTTSSTAAPVAFLGQLMPPRLLIVCKCLSYANRHAFAVPTRRTGIFSLDTWVRVFSLNQCQRKNTVAGAMRERFVGSASPSRWLALSSDLRNHVSANDAHYYCIKTLVQHPSFEHLTSPSLVPATTFAIRFQATTQT